MGVSFDPDLRIAGYRPSVFKGALLGFMRTGSPANLVDLKTVFPLRRDGAIVFEECLDRGLIQAETLQITEAGEVFARGKAKGRATLADARIVLDTFLGRVADLNQNPDAVSHIEQVWLFGSVMRERPTVGDIDLAVKVVRRPEYAEDHDFRRRRLAEIVATHADAPVDWDRPWEQEDWVVRRALYGRRRHPLLAGLQRSFDDLAALGVPCQLIYDRSHGGRVESPILPRHPESRGRDERFGPPPTLPDLKPRAIRPMDARWIGDYWGKGFVSPYGIFRGWTDDALKLFSGYPEGLRVLTKAVDVFKGARGFSDLKIEGLDGRAAIGLFKEGPGVGAILHRRIELMTDCWRLSATFASLRRPRRRLSAAILAELAATASLILAVDLERMLLRAGETSDAPRVVLELCADADGKVSDLAEAVHKLLSERAIRVEPLEWPGSKAVVSLVNGRAVVGEGDEFHGQT